MKQDVIVTCKLCGKVIDPARVAKNGIKKRPQFCNLGEANLWLKEHGHYKRLSKAGNAAQATIKAETGKAPGVRGGKRT